MKKKNRFSIRVYVSGGQRTEIDVCAEVFGQPCYLERDGVRIKSSAIIEWIEKELSCAICECWKAHDGMV